MSFIFEPSLPPRRPLCISRPDGKVRFYALSNEPDGFEPELWTSLPLGEWHAVPYTRQRDGRWWEASLEMGEGVSQGEFTYRLRRGEEVRWLGNEGGNGRVIRAPEEDEYKEIETRMWKGDVGLEELVPELGEMEIGLFLERRKPTWYEPVHVSASPLDRLRQSGQEISLVLLSSPSKTKSILIFPHPPAAIFSFRLLPETNSQATIFLLKTSSTDWNAILEEVIPGAAFDRELQGLNYCTWNSLGADYTSQDVLKAVKNLPMLPTQVLLDDGWGDTTTRHPVGGDVGKLKSYDTGSGWGSMKRLVEDLKALGVEKVGVWINALGYWGGLDETASWEFELVEHRSQQGQRISLPNEKAMKGFWNRWFGFLKDSGITFLKIDNLASVDQLLSFAAGDFFLRELLDAANDYFPGSILHSMPHSSLVFSRLTRLDIGSAIVRTSDDYMPSIPAAHPWHIHCNAYLSLLSIPLCFQPDFDMFQSLHPWAHYHASFRVFSPAPIWITDEIGKSDEGIFRQLIAQSKHGRKVMQLKEPGKIPDRRLLLDIHDGEGGGVLVFRGGEDVDLVGFWNVRKDGKEAQMVITRETLWKARGAAVAYLANRDDWVFLEEGGDPEGGATDLRLTKNDWEIASVAMAWELNGINVACLGLKNKFVGGRAVSGTFRTTTPFHKPSPKSHERVNGLYPLQPNGRDVEIETATKRGAEPLSRSSSQALIPGSTSRSPAVLGAVASWLRFLFTFLSVLLKAWRAPQLHSDQPSQEQTNPTERTPLLHQEGAEAPVTNSATDMANGTASTIGEEADETEADTDCIAVDLDFLGQVLFWVSNVDGSPIENRALRLLVDGLEVDRAFIQEEKRLHGAVITVDLEGWIGAIPQGRMKEMEVNEDFWRMYVAVV